VVDLPVKIPDILEALEVPRERQDNRAASRVRQIAASLGWWVTQRRHQGKTKKGLWPPTAPRPVNTVSTPCQHRGVDTKTQAQTGVLHRCQHRQHRKAKKTLEAVVASSGALPPCERKHQELFRHPVLTPRSPRQKPVIPMLFRDSKPLIRC